MFASFSLLNGIGMSVVLPPDFYLSLQFKTEMQGLMFFTNMTDMEKNSENAVVT